IANIVTATAELRARSGCDRVVAFGARLGGSLALATAAAGHFAELIVWDPIIDGSAHVAQLDELQARLQLDPGRFIRPRSAADVAGQWLGFPVSPRLRQQLGELHLQRSGTRTLVLDSLPAASARQWDRLDRDATVEYLEAPTYWDDLDRLEHAILSPELVRRVTARLAEMG
ncbi:MAG TPA: hypothetical protein VIM06_08340, partial [Rhodanobacter sp.]